MTQSQPPTLPPLPRDALLKDFTLTTRKNSTHNTRGFPRVPFLVGVKTNSPLYTMKTQENTLDQFIETHGISMTAVRIPSRPDLESGSAEDRKWNKEASHYMVTLYKGGNGTGKGPVTGSMTTFYSMGSAHKKAPKAGDVLDSLALDSNMVNESFEDWCASCGYDSDSRRAFATYEACRKIAAQLKAMLGKEAFDELLYNTERL